MAQQLSLPDRPADAPTGSEFRDQVQHLALAAREEAIFGQIMAGNVPDFLRDLVPVSVSGTAGGETLEATYFVTPDYLAVGSDDDYFLMPMTPILAQRIADATGTTMPTRRMVNQIWQAAPLKLSPRPIPPSDQMTTIPVMYEHHLMVWEQREPVLDEHPPGTLVAGHKKDVVLSNRIFNQPPPGRVVIYGWHQRNGSPIQPLYSGHSATYADYSHGIRLVLDSISVNGQPARIRDVLQHPERHVLLSDEGVIPLPFYPTGELFEVPDAWGVLGVDEGSLRLVLGDAPGVTEYLVQLSADGRNFSPAFRLSPDNPVITGLQADSVVYVRLQAVGEQAGAVVVLGFPFETVYPAATRMEMMGRILNFLGDPDGTDTGVVGQIGDGFGPGDPGRPGELHLHQNYPNPFNNATVITYQLPEATDVKLSVYSLEGRRVARLFEGFQPAGRHSVTWNASGLASGVYVCMLTAGPLTLRQKMTLLK